MTQNKLKKIEQEMNQLKERMKSMEGVSPSGCGYALGFVPSTFMAMNLIKASAWVENNLASKMKIELAKYPEYFTSARHLGDVKTIGFKSCMRFNRGEDCNKMWHVSTRPKRRSTGYTKELRIHCCILCMEALGVMACHHLLICPWLKDDTWRSIGEKERLV